MLEKLEELRDLIDKEDGKKAKGFRIHQWHNGEFLGVPNREKEEIIESLDLLQLMLLGEMQILLDINGLLDNSAYKQAIVALRNTEGFLIDNPPMERFRGTFDKI